MEAELVYRAALTKPCSFSFFSFHTFGERSCGQIKLLLYDFSVD